MTELIPAPSHVIGPTWQQYDDGGFYLPDNTLANQIVNWMFTYLKQPSGPQAGEPFLPTNEQYRFLCWWYALDDSTRFHYRKGVLRRLKGWGKDPIAAAMSLAELCGPVTFSHWDSQGQPVGAPRNAAWIQIAAVSQDQTRNTFSLFPAMISTKLKEEYGLEIFRTIIYSENGGMIEAVTSSPASIEGKRPTFVIKNETQWWMENNLGHEMSNVIQGNVDKASYGGCRVLSICNAHRPGEESDAEADWDTYQAIQAGEAVDTRLLYDALEAPADTPVSELADLTEDPEAYNEAYQRLREGLEIAKGDAHWLDTETLVQSILDVKNDVIESRRKFLNQINAREDAWISPPEWDAAGDSSLKLEPGDRITLGFDGSKGNDHTALVACRVEDAALFPLRIWNPEKFDGQIPRDKVNEMVEWVFGQYEVMAFRADVREFESYIDQWAAKYGKKLKIKATGSHPVAFEMRGSNGPNKIFTQDCELFHDAVLEKALTHNGNAQLRQHIINAHTRPNNHGFAIGKASKDSNRKIDAAVCAVLAFGARQDLLVSRKNKGRKAVIYR